MDILTRIGVLFLVGAGWSINAQGIECNGVQFEKVEGNLIVRYGDNCTLLGVTVDGDIWVEGELVVYGGLILGDLDVRQEARLTLRGNLGLGPTDIAGSIYSDGAARIDINAMLDKTAIVIRGDLELINNDISSCQGEVTVAGSIRAAHNRGLLVLRGCNTEESMWIVANADSRIDPRPVTVQANSIGRRLGIFGNRFGLLVADNWVGGRSDMALNTGGLSIEGNTIDGSLKVLANGGDIDILGNDVGAGLWILGNSGGEAAVVALNYVGWDLKCVANDPPPADPFQPSSDVAGYATGQCKGFDSSPTSGRPGKGGDRSVRRTVP